MAEVVDVLICGSGSAGLCAATWLARCGVRCKIIDSRSEPLQVGQADGVQCRTVEIFDSFGVADQLLRESYHVLEVCFWSSASEGGPILRTRHAADTAPGLSYQPHVILNQAYVNRILIDAMRCFNGQEVEYGYKVTNVEVDSIAAAHDPNSHCVTVTTTKDGQEHRICARYVLGCDGAHSTVRRALGYRMIGDSVDSIWGVMDIHPRTNFPDIRKKCAVQTTKGSLLIIPREGGTMVRFYIELGSGIPVKDIQLDHLHAAAKNILHPYELEFALTPWWSIYAIGQRLADHFTRDDRVFLTGDACHTHSPKAGQGMNVSLQDGYNIGWKLAAVLKKQATTELLTTYAERKQIAANLIDFDRAFAKSFSAKTKLAGGEGKRFSDIFVEAGQYTAGLATKYDASLITTPDASKQPLAENIIVGMRFPSTQVVRFCDARPMQLLKALPSDGRWRLVLFVGGVDDPAQHRIWQHLGKRLYGQKGCINTFTPQNSDVDSFIETILVFSGSRLKLEQEQIPDCFSPVTGDLRIRDLHKTYVDDEAYDLTHGQAYKFYGVDPKKGAVIIVRPDQYVSMVTGLEDYDGIEKFFASWALPRN